MIWIGRDLKDNLVITPLLLGVLLSFSIVPNHVLPCCYTLVFFTKIFALLKPLLLSCCHVQAHDMVSTEKRLGNSLWRRWLELLEDCLICWWHPLVLVSRQGFSPWYRALQHLIISPLSGINSSVYSRKIEEKDMLMVYLSLSWSRLYVSNPFS